MLSIETLSPLSVQLLLIMLLLQLLLSLLLLPLLLLPELLLPVLLLPLLLPAMVLAALLLAVLLLPSLWGQECGVIPEGLGDTEGLNRVVNGNIAPKHVLPWQVWVSTIYWDRITTGTDLLGLVAELVSYGLGMHSGFLLCWAIPNVTIGEFQTYIYSYIGEMEMYKSV